MLASIGCFLHSSYFPDSFYGKGFPMIMYVFGVLGCKAQNLTRHFLFSMVWTGTALAKNGVTRVTARAGQKSGLSPSPH